MQAEAQICFLCAQACLIAPIMVLLLTVAAYAEIIQVFCCFLSRIPLHTHVLHMNILQLVATLIKRQPACTIAELKMSRMQHKQRSRMRYL